MITINLLPDEFRRRAQTPVRMVAAIGAAVLINAGLFSWWCYLHFGVRANVETTRSVLQLDMDGLKPQVDYHEALQKEIATRSGREKTLAEITSNRVLWTKVVDELCDVVHAGREGIEHYVWFDDIQVKMEDAGAGRRRSSFGSLKAAGHSGSSEYEQVANFLEDIEDPDLSQLMKSLNKPSDLEAKKNEPDEDLIPSVNWSFPLELELKSPDERNGTVKKVEKPAKKEPAANAAAPKEASK
ncbi:MAG: hypothetical protein R3F49_02760 [Planctomycetota bacterium]